MRIIAGSHRGRQLLAPEGDVTRPVTDRVKQSLFDILSPCIQGATVLDLFAGTGSMGLECLSRGAARAEFFEADRSALTRLRQNIESFGFQERSLVRGGDLFRWFAGNPAGRASESRASDLIFLDPPYRFLTERRADLERLAVQLTSRHLAASGLLVFRHDSADGIVLPALERYDQRTYGGMTLEFLRLGSAQNLNDTPRGAG